MKCGRSAASEYDRFGMKAARSTPPIAVSAVFVVRERLLEPADMAERQNEPARRGAERVDGRPVSVAFFELRRLALEGVDGELMVGRQCRPVRRQDFKAQVVEIERADAHRRPDVPEQRKPPPALRGSARRRIGRRRARRRRRAGCRSWRRGEGSRSRAARGRAAARAPIAIVPTAPPAGGSPRHRPPRDRPRDRRSRRPRADRWRVRGSNSLATRRRALASVTTVARSAKAM